MACPPQQGKWRRFKSEWGPSSQRRHGGSWSWRHVFARLVFSAASTPQEVGGGTCGTWSGSASRQGPTGFASNQTATLAVYAWAATMEWVCTERCTTMPLPPQLFSAGWYGSTAAIFNPASLQGHQSTYWRGGGGKCLLLVYYLPPLLLQQMFQQNRIFAVLVTTSIHDASFDLFSSPCVL